MIEVTSRKFYSQFANGETFASNLSDYTQNLVGNVMERVVAETEFTVTVISTASTDNQFTVTALSNTITRDNGTWAADGWYIGDTFAATGGDSFTGTITGLSGTTLNFTTVSGPGGDGTYDDLVITKTNDDYTAAVIQFGTPENSDSSSNFLNPVDGSIQGFTLKNISTSYQNMQAFAGAKSWQTGSCMIKKSALTAGVWTYTVYHEFIILPYYLQEFSGNLTDGTLPDDWFAGNLTVKYTINLDARKVLTDPNISQNISDLGELGCVGWFNENYNGGVNNYACVINSYTDTATGDSADGLQIDAKTTVTATLTNTDSLFTADTKIGIYISAILDALDYAPANTLFKDLWTYDNAVKLNNNIYTGLSGAIKAIRSVRSNANTITINFDVEFSGPQRARLSSGQQFIIGIQTADSTLDRDVSDNVILLNIADLVEDADIPGLLQVNSFEHYRHDLSEFEQGASDFTGWVEDGFFSRYGFGLDIAAPARLKSLTFKLMARNSAGNEFVIQQYPFDLSSGVLVPDGSYFKQDFNLDTTRGFPLPAGDFFNRVRLGFAGAATLYFYGEATAAAPNTTFAFGGTLTADYATIFLGQYVVGQTGPPVPTTTGFTLPTDTPGSPTPNVIPWIAGIIGASIPNIIFGSVTLAAGQNVQVTHASISGAHTIIPCDVELNGMDFSGMNDSKTATTFEVTDTGNGGRLDYIIVVDGAFSSIRSFSDVVIAAGGDTYSFANLGSANYTALIFDTQFVGTLPTVVKNNDSIEITVDSDTKVNGLLILN